jgi:hypothetical protein
MKNVQKLFAIAFLAFVFTFSLNSCKKSDDVCAAAEMADLLLDRFEPVFKNDQLIGQEVRDVYEISHFILNSIRDLACTEKVASAAPSKYEEVIYYSADSIFSNQRIVSEHIVEFNTINANAAAHYVEYIDFQTNGYYKFVLTVDKANQVEERHEDNNNSNSNLKSNAHVIHVHGTKNKAAVVANTKVIIERLSQTVVYE